MKKLIFIFAMFAPVLATANIQTHNVYVHKAGIDTSMYGNMRTPKPVDYSALLASDANAKARVRAREADKRQSQYATDLITQTDSFKNVTSETILPLIQKYPENSDKLLEMLQKQ